MTSTTYALQPTGGLLTHGGVRPSWLGDYADDYEDREFNVLDAMAASGDYFITLATRLDKVAQGLPQDSAEQIEIEHLVKTLLYMQDHFKLVAKYKLK